MERDLRIKALQSFVRRSYISYQECIISTFIKNVICHNRDRLYIVGLEKENITGY